MTDLCSFIRLPLQNIALYMCSISSMAYAAERLFPLRSVSPDAWQWKYRPFRRFPGFTRSSWFQLFIFSVFGLIIGGIVRLFFGLRLTRSLPEVLRNGVAHNVISGSALSFDSEFSSEILAAVWLRKVAARRTSWGTLSIPTIMLRRLARRGYIFLTTLSLLLFMIALSPLHSPYIFLTSCIAWGILTSTVYRATSLGIYADKYWRLAYTCTFGLTGTILQIAILGSTQPIVSAALCFVAILYIGFRRGRPRKVNDFTVYDTGIASFPLEMFSYFLSGGLGLIPASIAAQGFIS